MDKINKKSSGDYTHSVVKGALGSVPVLGAAASEIFSTIITPPLEKRRIEWMNQVASRLDELEKLNQISFEELMNDDHFIDVVIQTTSLVLKTSEKEKIEAYKNALINTSLNFEIEETISKIYINQLENFTVWHLKIIKLIDNPKEYFEKLGINPQTNISGSLSQIIFQAFPELKTQKELLDVIWSDLKSAGFHNSGEVQSSMSGSNVLMSRTTQFGKKFIEFIEEYNT
jgi:hypothetical protein